MPRHAFAQQFCLPPYDPTALDAPAEIPSAESRDTVEMLIGRLRVEGDFDAEFSDQVEILHGDARITADRADYERGNQKLQATGAVTFRDPDLTVFGEDAEFDIDRDRITFANAGFDMPKRPARGSAEQVVIAGDKTVSLSSVLFTTCAADDVDWELKASEISLDVDQGFGSARGVKLEFKGVPILYAPYFTFPIDDQRKSGFLTPDFAERDRTGLDIAVPYYLNLAPNYDMTLEPRYMSKRGMQLSSEFRYLLPQTEGQFAFEYLPNDDETGQTRRYFNLRHETSFGAGWQVSAGLEEVSDDAYFEDLASSLSATSQTHLNRYLDLRFYSSDWSLLTRFQNYQTIDPLIAPGDRPYERVPQILFSGHWLGRSLAFDSTAELVNFERDVGTTGWRLDATQEVSVRLARSGMFLTPAVAFRQTNYWLEDPVPGQDDTLERGVPVASLDSGMMFERSAGTQARWTQTLEPRMLYVHVPFEDQAELPVFDTVSPDFNLIQLFRKYQFVGADRIADTDHLSLGITTRLIDNGTGREKLTATLGQTRYLSRQEVNLPGRLPSEPNVSDYVAEVSVNLYETWNLDMGYQWNSETDTTARVETRLEFRPQDDRLFGIGYRYRRGLLEQGDFSIVWPATERWRVIGRYSHSFLDDEPLEQFLGWEYDACCWRFSLVGRRYISRRTGDVDTAISLQLELKGLSQGARSPEQLLDRGILGYRQISGVGIQ